MSLTEKNSEVIVIPKKKLKGDDGYKVFSVRIKDETVEQLDEIARKSNRSRNELINIILEHGVRYCKIED